MLPRQNFGKLKRVIYNPLYKTRVTGADKIWKTHVKIRGFPIVKRTKIHKNKSIKPFSRKDQVQDILFVLFGWNHDAVK